MFSLSRFFATGWTRILPRVLGLLVLSGLSAFAAPAADDTGTGPNLLEGNFETGTETYNPWGGVDLSNELHVWAGKQYAVDDKGNVGRMVFSPSVAAGPLHAEGLIDLVVADPRGYIWYFPNSGTPKAPAFTHGEVMPVWCSGEWIGTYWLGDDYVPRIQLVDYDSDGRLDLVVGNNAGRLFFVHNKGSTTRPDFQTQPDRSGIIIPTHEDGLLWCNYLTPFLYDWSGTGRLDLLMGEGTYSANSIYLFTNQGGNLRPVLNEKHRQKIIPGMGREHLTPQVVDWNNDGKPDVISGERTGVIDVYLNKAANKGDAPSFDKDKPIHVQFGSAENVGPFATVCVADLNGDGLFDLIVCNAENHISYAFNTGAAGAPKFGALTPIKGVMPFPKILNPVSWYVDRFRPYGAPFGMLECTNAKIEKDFTPPPDTKLLGACKYSVYDTHPVYFKNRYDPGPNSPGELESENTIQFKGPNRDDGVSIPVGVKHTLSMWVRSSGGVSNINWEIKAVVGGAGQKYYGSAFEAGTDWTRIRTTVLVAPRPNSKPNDIANCEFRLFWKGEGTLYFDDVSLKKSN